MLVSETRRVLDRMRERVKAGQPVDFTSIPQTYSDLIVILYDISHDSGSNQTVAVSISSNNGSSWTAIDASAVTSFSNSQIRGAHWSIYDYASTRPKRVDKAFSSQNASTQFNSMIHSTLSTAINAVRVALSGGNYDAGTIKMLGR